MAIGASSYDGAPTPMDRPVSMKEKESYAQGKYLGYTTHTDRKYLGFRLLNVHGDFPQFCAIAAICTQSISPLPRAQETSDMLPKWAIKHMAAGATVHVWADGTAREIMGGESYYISC